MIGGIVLYSLVALYALMMIDVIRTSGRSPYNKTLMSMWAAVYGMLMFVAVAYLIVGTQWLLRTFA